MAFCFEVAVLTHVLLTKWFGILDTPDVGCKQGLVEAHDIIEQDIQGNRSVVGDFYSVCKCMRCFFELNVTHHLLRVFPFQGYSRYRL